MDSKDTPADVNRRNLIKISAAGAALSIVSLSGRGVAASAQDRERRLAILLSGEPSSDSIVLQVRFCKNGIAPGDMTVRSEGMPGSVRFEYSTDRGFRRAARTRWRSADQRSDFVVKERLSGLRPMMTYHYRAQIRDDQGRVFTTDYEGEFRTLPGTGYEGRLSFCVISCLSYELFFGLGQGRGAAGPWRQPAQGEQRLRGYPALDVIRGLKPDFVVATGDTVYYDHPGDTPSLHAKTAGEMRNKWHHQLLVPSVRDLLLAAPFYFMKDDHDFRFDDADNLPGQLPEAADARAIFAEQVPLIAESALPYRTYRLGEHVQIWMLEGRDYRSSNSAEDVPGKSLWGAEQRAWLESSLLESAATFKVVVSPGPLVGPDDARKRDNHANIGGFSAEGAAFRQFLLEKGLKDSTFIVCGDRHWQYHSVDSLGVEEFCCGTASRQNGRPGVAPGDPQGTDPNATIRQPYLQASPDGAFIQFNLDTSGSSPPSLLVRYWNESGDLQYTVKKEPASRAR